MFSQLTLISHASTRAVRSAAFPLDESIDQAGSREAAQLAKTFRPFAAAWSSPLKRAIETAEALNLVVKLEPSLTDIDLGRWAGRRLDEVEVEEPKEVARWLSDPIFAPHGGESIMQLIERVSAWLVSASANRGRNAAVTHPAVIRAAIVSALGAGANSFWRIDVAPLTVVELSSNGERWALRSIRN